MMNGKSFSTLYWLTGFTNYSLKVRGEKREKVRKRKEEGKGKKGRKEGGGRREDG